MKIKRFRRRQSFIPTASFGDIAFLLIIFFMLCSNFMNEANIRIAPPTSPQIEIVENASISIIIDEEGQIHVNGKPVDSDAAVEAIVENALQGKTTDEDRFVIFRCDRTIEKRIFEPVLEAITKAGGLIIAVGDKQEQN